jgi:hypothetical protein
MTRASISYDTIVRGDLTKAHGPIGLIVHDQEASRLVAISAANVVDNMCRLADTDQIVGTTSALTPERFFRARLRPASSLLTTVLIDDEVAISDGRINIKGKQIYPTLNRDVRKMIGRPVLVHLPGRPMVEALVVTTNAKFAMPAPDSGSKAFFEHALELFLTGSKERARRGDAGALVTTEMGEVIGLVVSASGNSTFAAPVAPLLRELRACVPLNPEIVERHNNVAARKPAAAEASDVKAENEAKAVELNLKTEEASTAWTDAQSSGKKREMLDAAALIEESCFA